MHSPKRRKQLWTRTLIVEFINVVVYKICFNLSLHFFTIPSYFLLQKKSRPKSEKSEEVKSRPLTRTGFLARPEGFEPPFFRIGICCVIQLRHERKYETAVETAVN